MINSFDEMEGASALTRKWVPAILFALDGKIVRFTTLRRNLPGISQKTLSETLRLLERDGMLKRTAYATIPPRVEYQLSSFGRQFLNVLQTLQTFARESRATLERNRQAFDLLKTATASGGSDLQTFHR